MNRRDFITLLGGATAWPIVARAQTRPQVLRLGMATVSPRTAVFWVAFDERMRELGYAEGQNLAVEFIHLGDQPERYDNAMRELLRRKIDIIVASGEEREIQVARAATSRL